MKTRLKRSCSREDCDWAETLDPGATISALGQCEDCGGDIEISAISEEDYLPMPEYSGRFDEDAILSKSLMEAEDADTSLKSTVLRVMPLVVAARTIGEIAKLGEGTIEDHSGLIEKLGEEAKLYGERLRKMEEKNRDRLSAGQRVSTGFPKPDDDNDMKRFLKMYIGADYNSITTGGIFHDLQLITVNENEENRPISLSGSILEIAQVQPKPVQDDEIQFDNPLSNLKVEVPVWYDKEDCLKLAKALAQAASKEKKLMNRLLKLIRNRPRPVIKSIIDHETLILESDGDDGRKIRRHWLNDGEIEKDLDLWDNWNDIEKLPHKDAEKIRGRVRMGIMSTLGRMRELGLVLAIRNGRKQEYLISPLGRRLWEEWAKEED